LGHKTEAEVSEKETEKKSKKKKDESQPEASIRPIIARRHGLD